MLVWMALWACVSEPLPVSEPEEPQIALPPPPPEPPPRNLLPTIDALTLVPETVHTGVSARVDVEASDPDGRPMLRYQWAINDRRILEAASDTLDHQYYKKGDEVTVTVTVSDGTDQRERALSFIVQNSSPTFLTDPDSLAQLDGFQVQSEDPDGDDVTYRLEGAPPGMSIGSSSGIISYVGSVDDPGGDYDVQIIAEDGSGGRATWSFSINVQAGSGAPEL